MQKETLSFTEIKELKLFKRGKVRDVYVLEDKLLIISTDRISCFDVVLPTPIPYKGVVLTQLSLFWFAFTKEIVPNHLITADIEQFPSSLQRYKEILKGRSLLVKKTSPIPIECVVRGYLSGSAWKEYQRSGSICGIKLPPGLKESERLPEPLFTPATKEESGHDINVSEDFIKERFGQDLVEELKRISIALYKKASQYAEGEGIIIADTKFEFGLDGSSLILIDEVFTPDSSRFWPKDTYKPGGPQPSFDKQFVRDYLESIGWDKNPPAPDLPSEIVEKTTEKYLQALKILLPPTFSFEDIISSFQ